MSRNGGYYNGNNGDGRDHYQNYDGGGGYKKQRLDNDRGGHPGRGGGRFPYKNQQNEHSNNN